LHDRFLLLLKQKLTLTIHRNMRPPNVKTLVLGFDYEANNVPSCRLSAKWADVNDCKKRN